MSANGKKTIVISNGILIDGTGNPPVRNDAIVIQAIASKARGACPAT